MVDRRVLQLLGPSTGGIRRHVVELARRLPEHGWTATIAGSAGVLGDAGLLDHVVPVPSGPSRALLNGRRALRAAAVGVDVVHAHGLKAGWLATLSGLDVPLVVTVHNLVLDEAAGRSAGVLRVLEGRLPGRAAAVVAVSPGIGDRFAGVRGAERVRVVRPVGPPPVPRRPAEKVRVDLGVAPDTPLVVAVARLHPQKDLPTLVRAAARLRERVPGVRVVVVGEGPDRAPLTDLIAELSLEDTVLLAGASDDAADELAAADVVAMCSLWESGPLVVAEALALGRPVVATPVGFVPELIEDGVSGRLVPVGDAFGLARALGDALADDRATAARMAAAGRASVQGVLGADRLVGDVAHVYDEVTSR
ncbi:MAG TPA: glycosyltransferase family 4 protein [Acidimicrobiales bacterium]|nr:glycosyltransferase family 4 protein [Acidimicrobiales bacterium]